MKISIPTITILFALYCLFVNVPNEWGIIGICAIIADDITNPYYESDEQ